MPQRAVAMAKRVDAAGLEAHDSCPQAFPVVACLMALCLQGPTLCRTMKWTRSAICAVPANTSDFSPAPRSVSPPPPCPAEPKPPSPSPQKPPSDARETASFLQTSALATHLTSTVFTKLATAATYLSNPFSFQKGFRAACENT